MSSFKARSSTPRNIPSPQVPGTAGPGKVNPYSRFIPKEELSGFSAWTPGHLQGEAKGVSSEAASKPGVQASAQAAPKKNPAQELAQLLHTTREKAHAEGLREGMAALEEHKRQLESQLGAQVGRLLENLATQLDDLQQDMARALAVTATQLAQQVVRHELRTAPELVAHVANEALEALLLSARHITLRLHPSDHALVAQGAHDVLQARHVRLVNDPQVLRGGCLVESDIGVIDASLEARWRRAIALVGCEGVWSEEAADVQAPEAPADVATAPDVPPTAAAPKAKP